MSQFARLFELENNEQVLLTSNYNDMDDKFEVEVRTDLDDCVAKITIVFDDPIKAYDYIKSHTMKTAVQFRQSMIDIFNS